MDLSILKQDVHNKCPMSVMLSSIKEKLNLVHPVTSGFSACTSCGYAIPKWLRPVLVNMHSYWANNADSSKVPIRWDAFKATTRDSFAVVIYIIKPKNISTGNCE